MLGNLFLIFTKRKLHHIQSLNNMSQNNNAPLDELDFSILLQLQQDGRQSFTLMAQALGVSISTIRTRVTKLIDDKTIQIIGRVNPEKVGFHAYASIRISVRPAKLIEEVANKLLELKEVSFLAITSGSYDLEVDVMCRDNNHLIQLINERISPIEGINKTKADMYFKVLKYAQPDLNLLE
jgi:Lrp/AsnC family transcriptional regulator for asnA, asnC and gidA